ncbi:MAG: DNA-3-methyladenine glycosylase I [Bacteroidia bacterium]|nr:DNA-3-methyladenine glycosylase I [Bacteroidia bacterium]
MNRCPWPNRNPLMVDYHDKEWGVPLHDDDKLFEYIVLDAFQAGLNWSMILNKRENLRRAFAGFDVDNLLKFKQSQIDELMLDPGIIRNKAKVNSVFANAAGFKKIQEEFGSFDAYIWQFTGGKTIVNKWNALSEMPSSSSESDKMSAELKKRGFKFVGSTICYAFMQAAGMVNDHLVSCFRYNEINDDTTGR